MSKKEYTITIKQDDDINSLTINRHNKGFNIVELIGFVETIKNELMIQFASMSSNNATVTRSFESSDGKSSTVKIKEN